MSTPASPNRNPVDTAFVQRLRRRLIDRPAHVQLLLGSAIAALCAGAAALVLAQTFLVRQQQAADNAAALLAAASQSEARARMESRRAAAIDTFLQEALRTDLVSSAWDERRFGIRQASMTRDATNRLLAELARARGRIFAAESFEISVKDPKEGLFNPPGMPQTELLVSVRGSLLYRAKAPTR
jgi:hypothetical protein